MPNETMRGRGTWAIWAGALLMVLSGCATTRGQARALGAQSLACPESEVTITSYHGAQYVVEGCGHSVEVDCQDPRTVDRNEHPEGHSFCQARKPR